MMKTSRFAHQSIATAVILLGGVLAFVAPDRPASAAEYNQRPFLGAGQSATVQRAITRSRSQIGAQTSAAEEAGANVLNPNATVTNTDCGKLTVGGIKPTGRPGERLPRENITVVRNVINAPINCGARSRIRR